MKLILIIFVRLCGWLVAILPCHREALEAERRAAGEEAEATRAAEKQARDEVRVGPMPVYTGGVKSYLVNSNHPCEVQGGRFNISATFLFVSSPDTYRILEMFMIHG